MKLLLICVLAFLTQFNALAFELTTSNEDLQVSYLVDDQIADVTVGGYAQENQFVEFQFKNFSGYFQIKYDADYDLLAINVKGSELRPSCDEFTKAVWLTDANKKRIGTFANYKFGMICR